MMKKMKLEDKIALHRRMAEGYRDAYAAKAVSEGNKYEAWRFSEDAVYHSPYFTGGHVLKLLDFTPDRSVDIATFAQMESKAFHAVMPDWGPVSFKYWAAENGFVMQTHFVGHVKKEGTEMSFYSIGFCETNDQGEIKRWETFVDGEEFGPAIELAIGVRGPFKGPTAYFEAQFKRLSELEG